MKLNKTTVFLILILLLAAFLRFYRLGSYPPINADEAAIGYNAWSLLKTGHDEHGDAFPLHFKSFGDYKPGGYFYLVLPFVATLGLNTLAVRMPAALMSLATVFLVFLLGKEIFNSRKLGLFWSLVLCLSPWHIHFSRGGWESNVAVFLVVAGVYFFFKSIKKDSLSSLPFMLSVLFFVFSLYVYHSARIIAPLLFLSLSLLSIKKLLPCWKKILLPAFFGIILLIPLAKSFLFGGASSRFSGVGLFADQGPVWRVNELINQHQNGPTIYIRGLHNKIVIYLIAFAENYFSHFDHRFLFIDGDEVPRSKVPDMGPVYLFEVIFLWLGISFWLKSKKKNKTIPFI